ncbi:MAG: DNA-processing protein DprA [Lachnospiraceae bacterium]|nr:DNA-processing protein DprA [Lachnospiraceae bacterium]
MGGTRDDYVFLTPFDSAFPERLKTIPQPPRGIYVKGSLPDPEKPSVAVIGARSNTEYGRKVAQLFAAGLARHGVQIISGMARGIDGIAQEAAVNAGGASFGVLGCGVNVVYPKLNAELFEKVEASGGIISEYPPDMEARAELFPQRNRIISGLCDILLVVEARIKSGTAITVRCALDQGRDVFAVPGRISDPLSVGCNALIADGAGVANRPEDILEALGLMEKSPGTQVFFKTGLRGLPPGQVNVLRCIDYAPTGMGELARKTGLDMQELMEILLKLELGGMITRCGASHYIKKI